MPPAKWTGAAAIEALGILVAAGCGCTPLRAAPPTAPSVSSVSSMESQLPQRQFMQILGEFTTPKTLPQLLKNIMRSAQEHLLLREEFFVEQHLGHVFGARRVEWGTLSSTRGHSASLMDFSDLAQIGTEEMSFSVSRIVFPSGQVVARLDVLLRPGEDIGFEQIQQLFGPDWKDSTTIDAGELHRRANQPPATAPGGNRRIEYQTGATGRRGVLTLLFRPNGMLSMLSFKEEE